MRWAGWRRRGERWKCWRGWCEPQIDDWCVDSGMSKWRMPLLGSPGSPTLKNIEKIAPLQDTRFAVADGGGGAGRGVVGRRPFTPPGGSQDEEARPGREMAAKGRQSQGCNGAPTADSHTPFGRTAAPGTQVTRSAGGDTRKSTATPSPERTGRAKRGKVAAGRECCP